MFNRLFRRARAPSSLSEMVAALRAASRYSNDSERAAYEESANLLDGILLASSRHADAPTRDAFAYALGRAELDLGDKLAELNEITKENHIITQEIRAAQHEHTDRAETHLNEFRAFGETVSERLLHLELRMDASELDRAALHASLLGLETRIVAHWQQIDARMDEAEAEQLHRAGSGSS